MLTSTLFCFGYSVPYAIEIAQKCIDAKIDITWWEECLHPDDFDGHRLLKKAMPTVKWSVPPSFRNSIRCVRSAH